LDLNLVLVDLTEPTPRVGARLHYNRATSHPGLAMATKAAIVLGASGSVGGALLRALFRDGSFDPIITLTRRSLPEAVTLAKETGRALRAKLVPEMNPAALEAAA
jgi:hypothetical protein